jgi:hypothetical protein
MSDYTFAVCCSNGVRLLDTVPAANVESDMYLEAEAFYGGVGIATAEESEQYFSACSEEYYEVYSDAYYDVITP